MNSLKKNKKNPKKDLLPVLSFNYITLVLLLKEMFEGKTFVFGLEYFKYFLFAQTPQLIFWQR